MCGEVINDNSDNLSTKANAKYDDVARTDIEPTLRDLNVCPQETDGTAASQYFKIKSHFVSVGQPRTQLIDGLRSKNKLSQDDVLKGFQSMTEFE